MKYGYADPRTGKVTTYNTAAERDAAKAAAKATSAVRTSSVPPTMGTRQTTQSSFAPQSASKSIADYSGDYAAARQKGDWLGMQNAVNAANALRQQTGVAPVSADRDIQAIKQAQLKYSGNILGPEGSMGQWYGSGNGYTYDSNGQAIRDKYADNYDVIWDQASQSVKLVPKENVYTATGHLNDLEQKNGDILQQYQDYMSGLTGQYDDVQAFYDNLLAQNEAAKKAAVQQGMNRLSQQLPGINQNYDELARQAYIANMKNQKALPEQLKAQGYSGGVTESTLAGANANYENTLNQGEQARANAVQGIANQIENLKATGDLSIADGASQITQQQLNAYQNFLAQQLAAQQFGAQLGLNANQSNAGNWLNYANLLSQHQANQSQLNLNQDQFDYSKEQDAKNATLTYAQMLYQATGDASMLKALGFNDAQIASMRNAWNQNQGYQNKLQDAQLQKLLAELAGQKLDNQTKRSYSSNNSGFNGGDVYTGASTGGNLGAGSPWYGLDAGVEALLKALGR